jgi:hypothetical protein
MEVSLPDLTKMIQLADPILFNLYRLPALLEKFTDFSFLSHKEKKISRFKENENLIPIDAEKLQNVA